MIPVEQYTDFYFITISILIFLIILPLFNFKENEECYRSHSLFAVILLLTVILFIGLRDPFGSSKYLGDTSVYTGIFKDLAIHGDTVATKDLGFYFFMWLASRVMNIQLFYLLCAVLYVLPVYYSFNKWFKNKAIFALVIYIVSMSFWPYGINGLRNGLATSFIIFSFSQKDKKWLMIIIMFVAASFHKSVILPIIAYFISLSYSNTKTLVTIWLILVIIMAVIGKDFGSTINTLMSAMFESNRAGISITDKYNSIFRSGFRLDFILYSSCAIAAGYYYLKKGAVDRFYIQLLNIYIISNTVWVIFIYAAYTNRVAFLSWFILPVIIIYPLLKYAIFKYQNLYIAYIIICTLGFTIFLTYK